jgi:EAL domain-containing protein (putative c-di-GMP-specific phosphodiesterase class I)
LGGDEFVLMLEDLRGWPEGAAAQAKQVGEKILAALAQSYLLNGRRCRSTASIGVAVFGDRQETASELLQQADIAMYQAKAAGRNTLRFFAPALQAAVTARAALEDDLRQAIKTSQFVLYFQPQIDRNRLVGAEALVRWNHPLRKILQPAEFIPLAEETGLILPLGKWVLNAACEQIAAWAGCRKSSRLSVAVNISARQFHQPDFVGQVLAALDRSGANPENLDLELTESLLVENIEDVIERMKELRSHGLRFSLDDFGTGYSSLAYLKRLPLNKLKIDRSFIRDILTDESSAAIAQTVIALGRALGLPANAEGVETEEQREFLTRIGCNAFQGNLFSPPLPLEEFETQWLRSARETVQVPTRLVPRTASSYPDVSEFKSIRSLEIVDPTRD